jgi:DNA-binding transcriptional regulator LsrR (DeoR family)
MCDQMKMQGMNNIKSIQIVCWIKKNPEATIRKIAEKITLRRFLRMYVRCEYID